MSSDMNTMEKANSPWEAFKIVITGVILGSIFGFHLYEVYEYMYGNELMLPITWCLFACYLSSFHLLEFFVTAIYHPETLSFDSYLVNHSIPYCTAILLAISEFWIEYYFWPNLKTLDTFATIGNWITCIGEAIRFIGQCTLGNNFTHIIRTIKLSEHHLVQNGIYKFLRHPSYTGWYYFVVGSQILLKNCICIPLYIVVAWWFFKERIPYEEYYLESFFPTQYADYKKHTYVLIPGIH
ncbi:hypothetical protein WA158_003131 [Blastocystis sp. Blastoise]